MQVRKVELRMNEEYKYKIIKKLVETDGNKKRAASKLNCIVRTVNRLIVKYKPEGKSVFIHGNRGRVPSTTIPLYISMIIPTLISLISVKLSIESSILKSVILL